MFSKAPRTYPWVGSLKLVVPAQSGLTGNLYCGLMDLEEMMFMLHFLREDDAFADVGSNVGVYSLIASGMAGAQSIAFEPAPETFAKLQHHVALNGLRERIECVNSAVGNEESSLRFTTGRRDCLNHVVDGDPDETDIEVPVTTLDLALKNRIPSVLKLDIEGYEWYALEGAKEVLATPNLKAIILEFNKHAKRYDIKPEQIENLLAREGYHTYRYDPFARTLEPVAFNTNGNSLWIKDTDNVLPRLKESRSYCIYGHNV